jgi:F-type H+-transporting ATPase subunit b
MENPGLIRRRGFRFHSVIWLVGALLLLLSINLAAASSEEGEHGEAPKGWVATDTYRVMNFAVLAAALFFILRKPMSQALNGRIQGIKQQLEDLEHKKNAAEKSLAECNEKMALLNKEAERLVDDYIRQGEEAKARILKEAEASAEKLKEQARKNIEHEFEQAKSHLQAEIVEQALAKAEEMIAKKITDKDQTKLVDEYLEKVVA